jgi:hypothetical protein
MPGKPRVRVKNTGIEPGPALDAWMAKSRGMKKLGATRIRYDLMPPAHEPGGQAMPFCVPEALTTAGSRHSLSNNTAV